MLKLMLMPGDSVRSEDSAIQPSATGDELCSASIKSVSILLVRSDLWDSKTTGAIKTTE